MTTTSMQFGQSAINVVLNEGQLPAKLSTDASGNTVLEGADGRNISLNKSYDQYGRPTSSSDAYAVPGYSGTPIELAGAAFTGATGGSVLLDGIPGSGTGKGTKLVNSGHATMDIVLTAKVPVDDMLMFTLPVYRAAAVSTPVNLKIYLLDTAGGFTNYWYAYATITASGDQLISIPRGGWNKIGTPTEATGFEQIRFRIDNATVNQCPPLPAGEEVLIGTLTKNPRTRAKIIWTHDDGTSALYSFYQLIAAYGWAGCAYVVPSMVGKPGYVTLAQLQEMKAAGWTIGNHSMTHPADALNYGIQLLGPLGMNIAVTGIDTATNIITCTANRAPNGYAAPITFSAVAAPGGVTLGTRYYPKNVGAGTFTIHPTLDDSIAGTNAIDITSAGTTVTFSYSDATADETAIRADFLAAATWLNSNGFDGWHLALPQALHDYYVHLALDSLPTETVRGVYDDLKNTSKMDGAPTFYTYPDSTLGMLSSTKTTTLPGPWLNLPAATAMSSGLTATVIAFIDGCIATGATGCLMEHGAITANVQAVADYLKEKEEAGLVDVVTASEWRYGFNDKL